jgi:hypothetical protein
MRATVLEAHSIDGGLELLEVGHVGANSKGGTSGMFDLEVSQI